MKVKLEVTQMERALIVAALMAYKAPDTGDFAEYCAANVTINSLAIRLGQPLDSADDGPEVDILRLEF